MSVSLANIERNDGKNTPGYSELWATYEKDVATIPGHTNFNVATPITCAATKRFWKIEFDPEVGAFSTTEENSAEGSYGGFTVTVNAHIAGNKAAIKNAIDKYCGVPLVLLGKRKSDGVLEILGEIGRGIILRANKADAGRSGNPMGYDLVGSMDYNHLPYDYTDGTIDVSEV